MERKAEITSSGIKKILKNYKETHAFAEYLWNGFDAKATKIDIEYDYTELGHINWISITDNGDGINLFDLDSNFDKFHDSDKTITIQSPKNTSILHGKNGVGRLTFFTFAGTVEWETTCKSDRQHKSGNIKIKSSNLKNYKYEEKPTIQEHTGTLVKFTNLKIVREKLEKEILPYLKKEFSWFLALNHDKNYEITINGKKLNYDDLIIDKSSFQLRHNNMSFQIRYIQWKEPLNKEDSKFYYLNSENLEIYKETTTLNRQGDHFYHSVYITSSFFDDFNFKIQKNKKQIELFYKVKSSDEYKDLLQKLNEFLREQRRPFLRKYATQLIENFETDGILPKYSDNSWDKLRKTELTESIKGLYEAQPKIFTSLNKEQKITFVRLLNLVIDSNERESIFKILEEVTDLEAKERKELAQLFTTTKLDRIINSIKLIQDRYKTYYQIKELVYNESLNANEVYHLQTMIEHHYWLFGEQYHLVTAAEPQFEEALKRYTYILRGEKQNTKINHPDKHKQMDIFACRQNHYSGKIENIMIELKHPTKFLGRDEYNQVDTYINLILKQPEFNASNMEWKFYLIGTKFDTSEFIERQLENAKNHGEKSLALSLESGRIRVYVKTWSEIFSEFELKHQFIDEKLKLEKAKLIKELETKSANEIILDAQNNSAIQPSEAIIPN